jgi:GNAT superfamily N-acetyltransferase
MRMGTKVEMTEQVWVVVEDDDGSVAARGSIVVVRNKLHEAPYAYIEDVFTEPQHRGKGLFTAVMERLILEALHRDCYKIVATSRAARTDVHARYVKLGFADYGKEFRLDL